MKTKKNRIDLLILGAVIVLAAAGGLLFWPRGTDGMAAQFSVNGVIRLEIDLDTAENGVIDLAGYGVPGKLEVSDHRVRFLDVTCPDKICERAGFLSKERQSAACMPNRAALLIREKK